jgi:signal transduction histidine kinase
VSIEGAPAPRSESSGGREPGFWERYPTRRWTSLFLSMLGAFVLLAAVLAGWVLADSTRVVGRLVDVNTPAYIDSQILQSALLNQETGIRGYQLSRDTSFLQPYTDGQAQEGSALDRLRGLLTDRVQLGAVDEVERRVRLWRQDYADPLVANLRADPAAVVSKADADRGKAEFDDVRARLTSLQGALSQERANQREEVRGSDRWRNVIFAAILAALLVVGILLALWLRVTILRPLANLRESTRRVAGGDFDQRIALEGPADLVGLGQDVESMRTRILSELATSLAAHELLEEQATELRRSNAELEQFAYVASHDLQEPLRKVASFCQMLERRYGDQLDDRGRQYIDFAVDGAKRMQVLINDLLTFSRVGRVNDRTEPVDLERAYVKALANLSGRIEDTAAVIEHDPLPTVVGDPTLLGMLFQNLIGNALKFRAADRAPLVRVSAEQADGGWRFAVSDNGIGVDPQFADKIFVIFQRLHNREQYGGTGIGLALCKKIVEYHGGRIWLDTDYDQGARFVFTLPLPADAEAQPVAAVPTAQGVAAS